MVKVVVSTPSQAIQLTLKRAIPSILTALVLTELQALVAPILIPENVSTTMTKPGLPIDPDLGEPIFPTDPDLLNENDPTIVVLKALPYRESIPAPILLPVGSNLTINGVIRDYEAYIIRCLRAKGLGLRVGESMREEISDFWKPNVPFRYATRGMASFLLAGVTLIPGTLLPPDVSLRLTV